MVISGIKPETQAGLLDAVLVAMKGIEDCRREHKRHEQDHEADHASDHPPPFSRDLHDSAQPAVVLPIPQTRRRLPSARRERKLELAPGEERRPRVR
jgi:hypothetical protein